MLINYAKILLDYNRGVSMLFSSNLFLFAFLPIVLFCYYISPRVVKNAVLLVFSLIFYAWGEPKYVLIMFISIIVGYVMGLLTEKYVNLGNNKKAKFVVALSIVINLGLLFFFKYVDFFIININKVFGSEINLLKVSLPLGISFYTFQILTYSIDVYRQNGVAQKNIINLATYITLFPQLIAGPIVRYETVAEQLTQRKENIDDFSIGIRRFVTGLGKKIIIANMAGEIFQTLSNLSMDKNTVVLSWICSIAFTIQIYFDFSGYSDMAIGLGKMFGFSFLENFDYPYISKSITEFWRRWHISLSTWFRDYVYIPLGGNRGSSLKVTRNIFIVWLLTGFWHGAEWNFIIWGLYYFVILMLEKNVYGKALEHLPKIVRHLYALLLINFGWVIFSYDKLIDLFAALKNMMGLNGIPLANQYTAFYLLSYGLFLLIAIVCSTPLFKNFYDGLVSKKENSKILIVAEVFFVLLILTLAVSSLASDSFNPFLYFRF